MTDLAINLELWPRQMEAFNSPSTDLLFGGATEGGKSHLARVCLITWCLSIPGLQTVLVRKKYADIWANHCGGPTGFISLLSPLVKAGIVKITREGITFRHKVENDAGELIDMDSVIVFKHCQDERQFDSAQGIETHVLVIDEATQISERLLRFFKAWVRMTPEVKQKYIPAEWQDRFPRIIYTANPIGPSVPYFKRNYVERCKDEKIIEIAGFKRQYLPSRYTDNLSVDAKAHKGRLENLDPKLAKALDEGDWNAITGEFFPEWDEERHVVTDFTPPHWWRRYRSFDWGVADPAAVYWVAISDGEPFHDSDNRKRWFPRGALVFYQEWYICDDGHANIDDNHPERGRRMRNEDMALGILERSEYHFRTVPTLTDSKPFQDMGGQGIADTFLKNGVVLTQADTSREAGWSQVRSRLIGEILDPHNLDESGSPFRLPMIYFTASCKYARDYMPALPRHPNEAKKEDATEHGEATHACDAIRYAVMAHTVVKDRVEPMQSRIERELRAKRPTVKQITAGSGIFK